MKTIQVPAMPTLLALVLVMVSVTTNPLQPCPSSPNCVSSQAPDDHFIAPLTISGDPAIAFALLRDILGQRRDTSVIAADDRLIQVEFTTTLGFVDDALFVLDPENRVIHIRSASRSGYWDFGKNRRRVEEIRTQYLYSL